MMNTLDRLEEAQQVVRELEEAVKVARGEREAGIRLALEDRRRPSDIARALGVSKQRGAELIQEARERP